MSSGRKAEQRRHFVPATHHYLDLAFAHLQVVLVVDIHPLQGTAHPLVRSHKEHNCKPTCRIRKRDVTKIKDSGDSGAQSCMHTARYPIILQNCSITSTCKLQESIIMLDIWPDAKSLHLIALTSVAM